MVGKQCVSCSCELLVALVALQNLLERLVVLCFGCEVNDKPLASGADVLIACGLQMIVLNPLAILDQQTDRTRSRFSKIFFFPTTPTVLVYDLNPLIWVSFSSILCGLCMDVYKAYRTEIARNGTVVWIRQRFGTVVGIRFIIRSEFSETTRTAIAVKMVGKQCVGCSWELLVALVALQNLLELLVIKSLLECDLCVLKTAWQAAVIQFVGILLTTKQNRCPLADAPHIGGAKTG